MRPAIPTCVARRCRVPLFAAALALISLLPSAKVGAAVTGQVVEAGSGVGIAGARVHLRARPDAPVVLTDAIGRFSLTVDEPGPFWVSAGRAYDPAPGADNYETGAIETSDGTDVVILVRRIPEANNAGYQPIKATPPGGCGDCHVDQLAQWSGSAHADAAIDPWVQDLYAGNGTPGGAAGYVFVDTHDPTDTGACAVCHAPNEQPADPGSVYYDEVASVPGLEGVTCTSCHQLHSVDGDVEALHLLGNAEFRFPDATALGETLPRTHHYVWGPLDDVDFAAMRASYAPVFSESRFCASCHEYVTPGSGTPGQTTYSEWLASPAAAAGTQCQDCHMPTADSEGTLADVSAAPVRQASQRHSHAFAGPTEASLAASVSLALAATLYGDRVVVTSRVGNRALGHDFPTGISLRNAFVLVEARIGTTALALSEGDTLPFWLDDDVPGIQEGDYSGRPGRGYAKVLEGRVNGQGATVRPVLFIDAEAVHSDTGIPAGASDTGRYVFAIPADTPLGETVQLEARLVYRRAWRALAVTKGWNTISADPWEYQLGNIVLEQSYDAAAAAALFSSGFEPGE